MTRSIAIWLASSALATVAAFAGPVFGQSAQPARAALTNSIGMEFVVIPAGTFQMGGARGP